MVAPVELFERYVPIAPYLLGVLLGDGSIRGSYTGFSCTDEEIAERSKRLLPRNLRLVRIKQPPDRCPTYRISNGDASSTLLSINKHLDELELRGLYAYEKFIPAAYLHNSVSVRLELLRGLMDTDGGVSKSGHSTYFYTTSPRLVEGVTEIVRSLGGTVSARPKRDPKYTHKGSLRIGRPAYNLCIALPPELNPFHLSRKRLAVKPKTTYRPTRYIVSVEPVGKKTAQCIQVEHTSQLYVTDDYIVTHNTMSIAAAVMEERRIGLITKPILTVPGHCLAQFSIEWLQMYPTAKLLVADEQNFAKAKRDRFVARATTGDWDCIIITHSAFKFIPSPTEFERQMIEEQAAVLDDMILNIKKNRDGNYRTSRKRLEQRKEALRMRFEELHGRKDDMVTIAEMGIDQIIVDEAQNFRKLSFTTNAGMIKGIDPDGSQRAWDLYVKSRYVATHRPHRALILASGTPITNTLGEMFSIQRFMAEAELHQRNIHEFDAWKAIFGETVTELELQPSGKYKPVTRFAEFINVPELVAMFRSFADVVQRKDLRDLIRLPTIAAGGRRIITAEATESFKAYQRHLGDRIDAIEARHGKAQPGDDIILSVITDGRHGAVDIRLVDRVGANEPTNKLNVMIDNVYRIWHETSGLVYLDRDGAISRTPGAGQMIFSDIGTVEVGKTRGFSAYEWIRERLIAMGVPGREIAFMQDYKKSAEKQLLFNAFNAGRTRILIGSSDTMGTGVNVQKRLKALHHLDVPWLPSQIEQREGRIERQGNENDEIEIYAYATPGSTDASMWQANERKARFIGMALSGDKSIRRLDDAASQANSFAIAKAIASGNPLMMQKAGLEADVARLRRLRSAHFDDQHALGNAIAYAKDAIKLSTEAVDGLTGDLARMLPTRGDDFAMTVFSNQTRERTTAGSYLLGKATTLAKDDVLVVGSLAGFEVVGRAEYNHISGRSGFEYGLRLSDRTIWTGGIEGATPVGLVQRLENAAYSIPTLLEKAKTALAVAERRIREATPRIGVPFEHSAELEAKVAELGQVEAELIEHSRIAEEERRAEAQAARALLEAARTGDTEDATTEKAA